MIFADRFVILNQSFLLIQVPDNRDQLVRNFTRTLQRVVCNVKGMQLAAQGRRHFCHDNRRPSWVVVMDYSQLLLTLLGFTANVVTFVTLLRMSNEFRPTTLLLLQHLSFVDSMVCLLSAIMHASPTMFHVGHRVADRVICHVWHSQVIYWWFINVSTATIVLIAVDRYLAVCVPYKHQFFKPRKAKIWLAVSYVICLINLVPITLQLSLIGGTCIYQNINDNRAMNLFYTIYAAYIWLTVYLLPCVILSTLYGKLICTFKKKSKNAVVSLKDKYHDVTINLTKTAILVTSCLLVTLSYDINLYMLSYMGVVEYEVYSPRQKVGTLLATVNSCANPVIYAIFMPVYRQNIVETIKCCFCRRQKQQPDVGDKSTPAASTECEKLVSPFEML